VASNHVLIWTRVSSVQGYQGFVNIPPYQVFDVPILVLPVAVRLEIVLPWPPFRLAVRTGDADEAFQRTFGGSFAMFCRLVVAIKIVGG